MGPGYYLQVLFSFIVLGILLYVFYKFAGMYKSKTVSGDIELIDKKVIDNNNSIVFVRYKKEGFLLSVGSNQTQVLKTYNLNE
ncbi:hypothetical protein DID76_03195 [Candidatus Marinamargulisbacteria bacterium SCGC AG-414-C22]|nr:hypothetical protein DID76_03195 [Candidatus Marinamargulisbacteria bacterium SCGC AG-414-C22]